MKIIFILLLFSVSLSSQSCVGYKEGKLKVVYNEYLNKYAIMHTQYITMARNRTDTIINFLLSCHENDYGLYDPSWQYTEWNIENCWHRSLFNTACEAKKFLLSYKKYLHRKKLDYWK